MQWVQKYACKGSSGKVSHEGVPFENVVSKVEIILRVIPQDLIEQHVSTPATIPLVEAKHSLPVEPLDALHIVTVDRRSIRLVKSYKLGIYKRMLPTYPEAIMRSALGSGTFIISDRGSAKTSLDSAAFLALLSRRPMPSSLSLTKPGFLTWLGFTSP